jgi:hypothetical protein
MAWRVFRSLLVLRDQVDLLAPDRATGADGTICDTNHPTTSDHCPHNVPGVGPEMVSALDLTHDPAGGFDSFDFAETLRVHRDPRIKYVISNHRMFSSYATSSYPAWTWRPYSGTDPHTNHVHVSVLDAAISDTATPWNLEGFIVMPDSLITYNTGWMMQLGVMGLKDPVVIPKDPAVPNSGATVTNELAKTLTALAQANADMKVQIAAMRQQLVNLQTGVELILAKLNQAPPPGTGGSYSIQLQGTATPQA